MMNRQIGTAFGLLAAAGLLILGAAAVKALPEKRAAKKPEKRDIIQKCESLVSRLEHERDLEAA